MFTVDYRVTEYFFDRAKVLNAINKAESQALSKAGAYIRTRARTSILRRRKKTSPPGSPPSVHSTDQVATLRNILFAYNPGSHSVFIGPVGLNQINRNAATRSSVPIPSLMEFGGAVSIWEWRFDAADELNQEQFLRYPTARKFSKFWTRRDQRWRSTSRKRKWTLGDFKVETRTRVARYAARPFMGPALAAEVAAGTIPNAFFGSVKAA